MANVTATVTVTSNGLKETTKEAQKLNKELDKVEKPRKAGSTGSRAADAALLSSKKSTDKIEEGLNRGTAAAQGRGEGRDFARQAQGLGGLVHVYATFAANIFAVSAAYSALSRAMNFELMVKSAEVMSTRVGTSLNNVATSIYNLTDAGISMKDAFGSANLAASAGLTTTQIEGLAKAAKNASLAMGRDMTDALNRVFRGTIKIEPELLDELGIMVKVKDVNQEYAKSIGKSASALTDFERRQAFVNGVLAQSEKKYAALGDIGVNSFDKLTASISNLALTIGGVLNTTLSPLVAALAASPTGLFLTITSIVGLLIKQAIPAFKDMGKAQIQALEDAEKLSKAKIAMINQERQAIVDKAEESVKAEKRILQESINTLSASTKNKKILESAAELQSVPTKDLAPKLDSLGAKITSDLNRASTKLASYTEAIRKLEKDGLSSTRVGGGKKEYTTLDLDKLKKVQLETAATVDSLQATEDALGKVAKEAKNADSAVTNHLVGLKELTKLNTMAANSARSLAEGQLRSNAVLMADAGNFREGWKSLRKEVTYTYQVMEKVNGEMALVTKEGTSTLSFLGKLRGQFNLLTSVVASVLSKFSIWFAAIGIGIAVLSKFLSWVGILDDKLSSVSENIDGITSSFKVYNDSIAALSKSGTLEDAFTLNTSALKAQQEAIKSLGETLKDYQEVMNKTGLAGSGSRVLERFKNNLGFGAGSDLKSQLEEAVKGLSGGAKSQIAVSLGMSPNDIIGDATKAFTFGGEQAQRQATQNLVLLQKEIEKYQSVSKDTLEIQAKLNSSYKIVTDSAEDYILGITKLNKEFDAGNEIFGTMSGLVGAFSDMSTGAELSGIKIDALATSISTFANSTTAAYAQLNTETTAFFQKVAEDIAAINKGEGSAAEKSAKVSALFNSGAYASFGVNDAADAMDKLLKASSTAATKLYELGKASDRAKLATATATAFNKKMESIVNYSGAPKTSEQVNAEFNFEDSLLRIQLEQLKVQRDMLEQTRKSSLSSLNTELIKLGKSEVKIEDSLPKLEVELRGELKQAISKLSVYGPNPDSSIPNLDPTVNKDKVEGLTAKVASLSEALKALYQAQAGKESATAAKDALTTQVKTIGLQLSNEFIRANKAGQANVDTKAYKEQSDQKRYDAYREVDAFLLSIQDANLGIDLFSTQLQKITAADAAYVDAYKLNEGKLKNTLEEQNNTYVRLNKELDEDAKKGGANRKRLLAEINAASDSAGYIANDLAALSIAYEQHTLEVKHQTDQLIREQQRTSLTDFLNSIDQITGLIKNKLEFLLTRTGNNAEVLTSAKELNTILQEQASAAKALSEINKAPLLEAAKNASGKDLIQIRQAILDDQVNLTNELTKVYLEQVQVHKQMRTTAMKIAEEAQNITDSLNGMFSKENMARTAEVFISKLEEGILNFSSAMQQLAEGLADSLNEIVDVSTEMFQKGELTFKSFITATRNTLSDMFRDIASSMFKQALFTPLIDKIKKMFPGIKTDAERANEAIIKSQDGLKKALDDLRDAINLDKKSKTIVPPEKSSPAETFPYTEPKGSIGTPIGPQAEPIPSSIKTLTEDLNLSHPALLDLKESSTAAAASIRDMNETVDLELMKTLRDLNLEFKDLKINLEDIKNPNVRGTIEPTGGSQDISGLLDEADLQITKNAETITKATTAKVQETEQVYTVSNALLQYNESLAEAIVLQNETVTSLDNLQAAFDSLISKAYATGEALGKKPTSITETSNKALEGLDFFKKQNEKPQGMFTDPEDFNRAIDAIDNASSKQSKSASTDAETSAKNKLSTDSFFDSVKEFFNVGNLFETAINKLLSGLGGGGGGEFNLFKTILGVGVSTLTGGIGGAIGGPATASTAVSQSAGGASLGFVPFAEGGIMTAEYGPLKLNKYASGGIANSPQAAIFGEGAMPEAYVPLPNGKSIPVSMNGPVANSGDTNITVQVNIDSNGRQQTNTQSSDASKFGKNLSLAVKQVVQEELIKQQRPGGLLYNNR